MKIIVTGGRGYVGQAVIAALHGFEILSIDDTSNSFAHSPRVEGGVDYQYADIINHSRLEQVMLHFRPDVIIHTAAEADVSQSLEDPIRCYGVNVMGTLNVLDAARRVGCRRIIFSSSAAVYSQGSGHAVSEVSPTAPATPYGLSKLQSEQQMSFLKWFDITCFRYFNVAGAFKLGEHWVKERRKNENHIIPNLLNGALGKVVFSFHGDPNIVRDYVHVRDVADAHVKVLERGFEPGRFDVYNIGSGHGIANASLLAVASQLWGVTVPFELTPGRAGDPAYLVADCSKMLAEYNWQANPNVEYILKSVWEAREQP